MPATRSAAISGKRVTNACTATPPIEWPDQHRVAQVEPFHHAAHVFGEVRRASGPAVPTIDCPWPRWSNAIVRKPASGSVSSWWNHDANRVRDAVREHDRRALARLDEVDRAAVERVEALVDVDRRVERARRVAVGPVPQPAGRDALARVARAGAGPPTAAAVAPTTFADAARRAHVVPFT